MAAPATTGKLCTTIQEMDIGDYIIWKSINGVLDYDFVDNTNGLTEVPITGQVWSQGLTNYYWYGVKVAKGLIVSDRVVKNNVSWDTLNSIKLIQGKPETLGGVSGIIRSLTGGVAYADVNGNKSLKFLDKSYGCYPVNNEYDKYINNFPTELIQEGKSIDDIFHCKNIWTWTQDSAVIQTVTSSSGTTYTANSSNRVLRGNELAYEGIWGDQSFSPSNNAGDSFGFRPVFEYKEV